MSELEAKAVRLLAERRVRISCAEDGLRAVVRGDHGSYEVRVTRRGLSCSCPSWRRRCSHARAVELVTGGEA